ncbi:prephenate dehydrogenase [Chloroflexota bacterium]
MRVAIIGGSGKMGRWFADFLLKDGKEVIIIGRNEKKLLEVKEQLGVEVTTNMGAIERADAVLLSVPASSFEEVVKQISPHTHPEQVIMDNTSVKTSQVETMHRYIKRGTTLGTHPVFGPGARSIVNKNFVLTPTNDAENALAQRTREYLEDKGAKVSLMTPQEHDEMMTVILGLSHFIAIVSADTLLSFDRLGQMEAIGGTTYKVLLTLVESVISEDPELYASLQMSLPNVTEVEKLFQTKAKTWTDLVANKDRQKFVEQMGALKAKLEKSTLSFSKAYENVYKMLEVLER